MLINQSGAFADARHIIGELMKNVKFPRKVDANFADELV